MHIETLDSVVDFIIERELIVKGDRVGVGVSGGGDSMALLHFLHSISEDAGFSVIAVHVNHNMRPGSKKEAQFVSSFCKQNSIEYIGLSTEVLGFAKQNKMGIEQAARIKRYESFDIAIKRAHLTKLALAHHQGDQAETILMHIFRGSGLGGAGGMEAKRDIYIRPFLETTQEAIVAYNYRFQVPYIQDESNMDSAFTRNFLRNEIMPIIKREWRNVEKNLVDFGKTAKTDDQYINTLVDTNSFQVSPGNVRVPLTLFYYHDSVVNRLVISAFDKIGMRENLEKKHIELITTLARTGENGSRVDLPNNLFAVREYEYLAIVKRTPQGANKIYSFKIGKINFAEYGVINTTRSVSYKQALDQGLLVIDSFQLPKGAKWRTRKEGDVFEKFGGGTKNLAKYMIDRKIPTRLRDRIPVLAHGNEVFVIAGVEISDKVKVTNKTLEAYVLEFFVEK